MTQNVYLLKEVDNSKTYDSFLARLLGSGSNSVDPFYLTSITDFAIKCFNLLELYELISEVNLLNNWTSKKQFVVVMYDVDVDSQSFSNPKRISHNNLLSEDEQKEIMKLNLDLLSEEDKRKFIQEYGN